MYINGIGTSNPEHCYSQQDCWEVLRGTERYRSLSPRSQALLRKVLTGANGIETRHLALEKLESAFELSPDALNERFCRHAPALAAAAGSRAIQNAGVPREEIDAVLISTCTGYLCPGLTSYTVEALGLNDSVLPLDLVGQGCAAALPGLMTAEALLESGRCRHVLCICVEVCSAAFYLDDDPGVLISACLFGDGAGAVVAGREPGPGRKVKWIASESLIDPQARNSLRFEQKQGMLRNVLAPEVPKIAAVRAEQVLSTVLRRTEVDQSDIKAWILHPGGRDVLCAIGERLALDEAQLRISRNVLRRFGNLSSPSVFFVLADALQDSVPSGLWWMSSFGAGFSCHGALLEVE